MPVLLCHCSQCGMSSCIQFEMQSEPQITLGPQEIIDCVHEKIEHSKKTMEDVDKKDCIFYSTRKSLTYVTNYGISLEENYPFQARRCLCEPVQNTPRLKLKNFTMMPTNCAEKIIVDLINCHPITGVIKMTEEFIELENEIYSGPINKYSPQYGSHTMLVVGYGEEDGEKFYWVQNSGFTD